MNRKALIIEGGGMRSAYVTGALVALKDLGRTHFDVVVGTSAGACCAINFVGGFPERNFVIMHDYLASARFINYLHTPTFKNVVDIDFLLDEVTQTYSPLPLEEIRKSSTEIYIVSTDCHTGQPVFFNARQEPLVEILRASCALPYFYRRKVFIDQHRMVDGGVAASIPIQKALEEGCNELYVISTRPAGYRKKKNPLWWLNHLFFPRYPNMVKTFNQRWQQYNQTIEWLENPPPDKKIVLIRPEGKLPVGRTTKNRHKIKAAYEMGYQDTQATLKKHTAS